MLLGGAGGSEDRNSSAVPLFGRDRCSASGTSMTLGRALVRVSGPAWSGTSSMAVSGKEPAQRSGEDGVKGMDSSPPVSCRNQCGNTLGGPDLAPCAGPVTDDDLRQYREGSQALPERLGFRWTTQGHGAPGGPVSRGTHVRGSRGVPRGGQATPSKQGGRMTQVGMSGSERYYRVVSTDRTGGV